MDERTNSRDTRDVEQLRSPCERARLRACLAPDGELPARESRLLRRHLAICPPCAAYAFEVDAIARLLRRSTG